MDLDKGLNDLIKSGKKSGYVTANEILTFCDEDSEEFEIIEKKLSENSIDIISEDDNYKLSGNVIEDIDERFEDKIVDINLDNLEALTSNVKVDDPVRMYLKEIGRISLLTNDEEMNFAVAVSEGRMASEQLEDSEALLDDCTKEQLERTVDKAEAAKKRLIDANMRLVVSIAKHYSGRGMQLLDLIQEGNMGLMKAVDKFDYGKGFKFSTYATWWIRQSITRAVADQARTIRIPVHMVETINKLVRVQRQLVQELSREPFSEEVADKMGISIERVQMLQKIAQEPISIDSPVGEDDGTTLGEIVGDPNEKTPYDFTSNEMLKREINEILETLTDREEKVLRMRFGLLDGRTRTLEEVGKEFGVTRERIRQIETKALRKLKHPSRSKKLTGYVTC